VLLYMASSAGKFSGREPELLQIDCRLLPGRKRRVRGLFGRQIKGKG
jgi:hypothetical protein